MPEHHLTIQRIYSNEYATAGRLIHKGQFLCMTLEPPERPSAKHEAVAVERGFFNLTLDTGGKLPELYRERHGADIHPGMLCIHGVPGRSEINFHCGRHPSHTLGCPLIGSRIEIRTSGNMELLETRETYARYVTLFMDIATSKQGSIRVK